MTTGVCGGDWKVAGDNYLGFGGGRRECNRIFREKKGKEAKKKQKKSQLFVRIKGNISSKKGSGKSIFV